MFRNPVNWNLWASAVYAAGVWLMLGSYAYLRHTGRYGDAPAEPMEEQEDPHKETYTSSNLKIITTYKKDFVPYTTEIYNPMKLSRTEPGPGSEPGEGDQ